MSAQAIEIRSYRAVFDLERRIYRIDRLRLNPGGVPLRGVVYCVTAALTLFALGALPVTRVALSLLPWYMRDVALPVGVAALLTVLRVDGRPFHGAAVALARYAFGPRRLCGLARYRLAGPGDCWPAPDLVLLPDGSDARLRRLRYSGAGAVRVAVAHRLLADPGGGAGRRLVVGACGAGRALERARVLELSAGARLDVG